MSDNANNQIAIQNFEIAMQNYFAMKNEKWLWSTEHLIASGLKPLSKMPVK